jgi:N-acetylmuramate 1-kinase
MHDRQAASKAFLTRIGWGNATRIALAGDASARRYERVMLDNRSAILMDSPQGVADDPADFVKIAHHLRKIHINAPEVYFVDLHEGYLLLEDLGDDTFAKVLQRAPQREGELYALASDVLVRVQAAPPPDGLADLQAGDWADAAMLALDGYCLALAGTKRDPTQLQKVLTDAIHRFADGPRVVILRDYHAENLMWLPDRQGLEKAGVLDFQLAQMGQPGYDLVSLLQDARREVGPATEATIMARLCAATETDPAAFRQSYAILGVQRALRILGVFARLALADGKPGYLRLIPRVWAHLQRNLVVLDLAPLTELCDSLLPRPTETTLEAIARTCV